MKHFVMLPAVLSVVAADLSDGACGPKPPTVPEFDKDMYLGDWYTQYTIPATFSPEGLSACSRAQYGSFENGTISVYNTGSGPFGYLKTEICGWAEQSDPENAPGDLIVYFYGNPGDYWILDTDFESFSSVYNCNDGATGDTRFELAYILTREIYPSDETIEKAFDAFARNNLTLDWFAIPHNEDCEYDKSPSCKDEF